MEILPENRPRKCNKPILSLVWLPLLLVTSYVRFQNDWTELRVYRRLTLNHSVESVRMVSTEAAVTFPSQALSVSDKHGGLADCRLVRVIHKGNKQLS